MCSTISFRNWESDYERVCTNRTVVQRYTNGFSATTAVHKSIVLLMLKSILRKMRSDATQSRLWWSWNEWEFGKDYAVDKCVKFHHCKRTTFYGQTNHRSLAAKSMKNQCKMSGSIAINPKYSQSYCDGLFSHGIHSLTSLMALTRYPLGHAPQSLQLIEPFSESMYRPQYKPGHFVLISTNDVIEFAIVSMNCRFAFSSN